MAGALLFISERLVLTYSGYCSSVQKKLTRVYMQRIENSASSRKRSKAKNGRDQIFNYFDQRIL